jgi:hypothetical protein
MPAPLFSDSRVGIFRSQTLLYLCGPVRRRLVHEQKNHELTSSLPCPFFFVLFVVDSCLDGSLPLSTMRSKGCHLTVMA